jgi:hypothetical protein
MAGSEADDNRRYFTGPRPVGALLPRVTRAAFRNGARASAAVLADWEAIVGPALAAVTAPRRLTAGTLTIACPGPIALELQHLSSMLIGRINAHLGGTPVERLRFVQQAPSPLSPAASPPALTPELAARVEAAVEGLPEALRTALAALGKAVAAQR